MVNFYEFKEYSYHPEDVRFTHFSNPDDEKPVTKKQNDTIPLVMLQPTAQITPPPTDTTGLWLLTSIQNGMRAMLDSLSILTPKFETMTPLLPPQEIAEKVKKEPQDPKKVFNKAIEKILPYEGGVVQDCAGLANKGIVKKYYDAVNGRVTTDEEFIKETNNLENVKNYYYKEYWIKSGAHKIAAENPELALVLLDTAINSGVSKAKRLLAQSNNDAETMIDKRLASLKTSKNWDKYGRGWSKRIEGMRQEVLNGTMSIQNTEYLA